MRFSGIQKTSLIDFPHRMATVLFTPDCNLRCPFCHNWRLVLDPSPPFLDEEEAIQILKTHQRFVDAVVITGGEPTIQRDIPLFLRRLKENDFSVKLDTNGFFPRVLEECLEYTDYIALDIKTSLEKYEKLGAIDTISLLHTIDLLRESGIEYEFRSTVVPGFVGEEDLPEICEIVKGGKRFAFQQFIPEETLDENYGTMTPYTRQTIEKFADAMRPYVEEVILRI